MPDRTTRAADGFAELVLADPEWVRAEFDALVAANFGPPPRPVPPARRPRRRPRAREVRGGAPVSACSPRSARGGRELLRGSGRRSERTRGEGSDAVTAPGFPSAPAC